jgi:hypothetical protein
MEGAEASKQVLRGQRVRHEVMECPACPSVLVVKGRREPGNQRQVVRAPSVQAEKSYRESYLRMGRLNILEE